MDSQTDSYCCSYAPRSVQAHAHFGTRKRIATVRSRFGHNGDTNLAERLDIAKHRTL